MDNSKRMCYTCFPGKQYIGKFIFAKVEWIMEKESKIIVGFKTVILGLCLYIIELLSLPIFGILQKMQTNGDGFYSDFWKYAGAQPYPAIFILTGIVIVLGIAFIIWGYKDKK